MPFFRIDSPNFRAWDSSYAGRPLSRFHPMGDRSLVKALFSTGSSLPLTGLSRIVWDVVDQFRAVRTGCKTRRRHGGVGGKFPTGHQVVDWNVARKNKIIRDHAPMAPPPHRLRTHDR